ncbi:hypothetical protein EUGRSUZ_J01311 [Eucalyptus grandis]|uniref:Uncharacterized protein n=2 Tax=Eucalyptus grandis TaxID=71139 RepID=A0ACC3JYU7_EUCGR|nr:hypothetical protein EUGRSUZ_J01311 [Eucalyptus grandis]
MEEEGKKKWSEKRDAAGREKKKEKKVEISQEGVPFVHVAIDLRSQVYSIHGTTYYPPKFFCRPCQFFQICALIGFQSLLKLLRFTYIKTCQILEA